MNKKQLQKMLQQAQSVQEKLEEEMNNLTIEASSGGGMVTAVVDGRRNLKSITLKDLILAAVNEASRKADEVLNSQLGGLTGGLLGGLG